MYVRTEKNEVIEIFVDKRHIHEVTEDYKEDYAQCYSLPNVKPIEGTSLWQLFLVHLNGDGELCVATFDTVKEANEALRSLKMIEVDEGWDAIEYKNEVRPTYTGGGGGDYSNVVFQEVEHL